MGTDLWVTVGIEDHNDDSDINVELVRARPDAPVHDLSEVEDVYDHYIFPEYYELPENCKNKGKMPDAKTISGCLERLEKGLYKWYNLDTQKLRKGFTLKIWTDAPVSVGYNTWGAAGAAIGILMYQMYHRETWRNLNIQLRDIRKKDQHELVDNQVFQEILLNARWSQALLSEFVESGAATFSSLYRTYRKKELIIYWLESDFHDQAEKINSSRLRYRESISALSHFKYHFFRMELPGVISQSYDFAFYFSGAIGEPVNNDPSDVNAKLSFNVKEFKNILINEFPEIDFLPDKQVEPLKSMLDNRRNLPDIKDWYMDYFCGVIGGNTWKIITNLSLMTKKEIENAREFLRLFKVDRQLHEACSFVKDKMKGFINNFLLGELLPKELRRNIWIRFLSGKGGTLMVIAKREDILAVNEYFEEMLEGKVANPIPKKRRDDTQNKPKPLCYKNHGWSKNHEFFPKQTIATITSHHSGKPENKTQSQGGARKLTLKKPKYTIEVEKTRTYMKRRDIVQFKFELDANGNLYFRAIKHDESKYECKIPDIYLKWITDLFNQNIIYSRKRIYQKHIKHLIEFTGHIKDIEKPTESECNIAYTKFTNRLHKRISEKIPGWKLSYILFRERKSSIEPGDGPKGKKTVIETCRFIEDVVTFETSIDE